MVRVVSQETYDEVVLENMKEFEMDPEEAVKEAVAQFEAQGVDLSNIIKDSVFESFNRPVMSNSIVRLKHIGIPNNHIDVERVVSELNILRNQFKRDLAHRVRAGKEGAYEAIMQVVEATHKKYLDKPDQKHEDFLSLLVITLANLMDTQPDLLNDRGINFIKSSLDTYKSKIFLRNVLKWASTCCVLHETNKQKLFEKDIGESLKAIICESKEPEVLISCFQLIRKLSLDDDIRVEFSKAHERSRGLGFKLLPTLAVMLTVKTSPPLLGEVMLTISCLLVCSELCAKMTEAAGTILTIMAENYDREGLVLNVARLLTASAGNDDVKRELVKCGVGPIVISMLSRHVENASVATVLLKCIAALTLREPQHSKEFLENGAAEAIVECMYRHEDNADLQVMACRAIRNMAGRCRDYNHKFHELGIESLLKKSLGKFEKYGFEIKSALRDLDCDVKLDEQWTGRGVQMEQ